LTSRRGQNLRGLLLLLLVLLVLFVRLLLQALALPTAAGWCFAEPLFRQWPGS
jgi:hypothetical protein